MRGQNSIESGGPVVHDFISWRTASFIQAYQEDTGSDGGDLAFLQTLRAGGWRGEHRVLLRRQLVVPAIALARPSVYSKIHASGTQGGKSVGIRKFKLRHTIVHIQSLQGWLNDQRLGRRGGADTRLRWMNLHLAITGRERVGSKDLFGGVRATRRDRESTTRHLANKMNWRGGNRRGGVIRVAPLLKSLGQTLRHAISLQESVARAFRPVNGRGGSGHSRRTQQIAPHLYSGRFSTTMHALVCIRVIFSPNPAPHKKYMHFRPKTGPSSNTCIRVHLGWAQECQLT